MTNPLIPGYSAPLFLKNVHIQNILSTSKLRNRLLKRRHKAYISGSQKIVLETPQNVRLAAKLNQHKAPARSLVILIHGWEGSSNSAYLLSMAAQLFSTGHDTLRLHLRDHGYTTHLNKEIFNSSLIDEVVATVSDAQRRYEYDSYHIVGFSLGGNFALRIGLNANELYRPLDKLLAICPVIDPVHTHLAINNAPGFYAVAFVQKWKHTLREKAKHFPDYASYMQDLNDLRTMDDMYNYLIPGYTPYDNLEDYFQSYALTGDSLTKLQVLSLIIASQDDPIIPVRDFDKINLHEKTELEFTRHGGHCAYLDNYKLGSWLDKRANDFFK